MCRRVSPPPTEIPGVSPQSTQSTVTMTRLLQEVLELLPESGRQAALRLPSRLVDKIRMLAASTVSSSFPSILGLPLLLRATALWTAVRTSVYELQ